MARNPRTIQLWRRCLRCCKVMEGAMGDYYHGFAREHIVAHREEDDPERLEHLLNKGEQNLRFVLRKYRLSEPRPPEPEPTKNKRRRRRRAIAGTRGDTDNDGSSTWTPGR